MYTRKEKLRLTLGIIVFFGIFIFLGINSCTSRHQEFDDLLNVETKFSSELPKDFITEVIDVNSIGGYDVRVSNNEKIIGFSLNSSSEISFELIKSKLLDNNWKCLDNGNKNSTTFYKDEGTYTWLFLNCVDIGGMSSAVFTSD